MSPQFAGEVILKPREAEESARVVLFLGGRV